MIQFNLNHKDPHSKARAGSLITDHGIVETPIYASWYTRYCQRCTSKGIK